MMLTLHAFGFGSLAMILVWGVFVWFIIWLISQNRHDNDMEEHETPKKAYETPKKAPKLRLAKGKATRKI